MDKLNSKVFINYRTHLTKCLTISALSMDIFLRRFYNNNIPLINKKSIYNNLKNSYYGGITEVYKPYGKNLFYYDVNSLYPYSALNPMPGLNCVYEDVINKNISDIKENIFGFYYCKIKTSDNYIGLLPYRSDHGLIMPLGSFEGWYFSEELKFAFEHGYKIDIISGYTFDRSYNVFDSYIKHMFDIKAKTNDPVEKAMVKSLLNNLLGRFGLDINKYETKLVSTDVLKHILSTRDVKSQTKIDEKTLVSYNIDISKDICESHGLDFNNEFKESIATKMDRSLKEDMFNNVSIAISSAVTSYSRIYMNKIKLYILNKGGNIYYTDTDSIVTDIKLDDSYVGKDLGQFKLEHEIKEGYFISNKTYAIKTLKDKIIKKSKGLFAKTLTYDDYINVYKGNIVETKKYESKKDFTKGSVVLYKPNKFTLSPFSYTKREKIFKDLWVDTKPLNINRLYTNSSKNNYNNNLYLNIFYDSIIVLFIFIIFIVFLWLIQNISIINEIDINTFDSGISNINNNININNIDLNNVKAENKSSLELYLSNKNYNINKTLKDSIPFESNFKDPKLNSNTFNKVNEYEFNSNILNKVKEIHLQEAIQEIEKLNKENSELKIDLIKHRIDKLDRIRDIDNIIRDLR